MGSAVDIKSGRVVRIIEKYRKMALIHQFVIGHVDYPVEEFVVKDFLFVTNCQTKPALLVITG